MTLVPSAAEAYAPRTLSEAQAQEELSLLRDALTRIHPGYERYVTAADLEARWGALEALSEGGVSELDWYVEISRLLAALRCAHTKAEAPEPLARWREENAAYLPLQLEFFGHRAFIAAADEEQPHLRRGQEVLAIDGRPMAEIVEALLPLLSVDGFTEESKQLELGFSSELQGAAIDHFGQMLWGFRSEFELTVAEPDTDEARKIAAPAVTYPRWLEIVTGGERYLDFADAVSFRRLDAKTALLSIDTFVNYRRPVDPIEILGPHFRELREHRIEHLVVDLRRNGGGSTEPAALLLRLLLDEPFRWGLPSRIKTLDLEGLAEHLSTWDPSLLEPDPANFHRRDDGWYEPTAERAAAQTPIEPHPLAFAGRVTVLTSRGNSSGSTHLIAKLRSAGRARLVGEPTGGNRHGATAGVIFFLELPHSGIRVRVPVVRTVLDVEGEDDGRPLEPDVLVPRTPESFFDDTDKALAGALATPAPAKTSG